MQAMQRIERALEENRQDRLEKSQVLDALTALNHAVVVACCLLHEQYLSHQHGLQLAVPLNLAHWHVNSGQSQGQHALRKRVFLEARTRPDSSRCQAPACRGSWHSCSVSEVIAGRDGAQQHDDSRSCGRSQRLHSPPGGRAGCLAPVASCSIQPSTGIQAQYRVNEVKQPNALVISPKP